MRATMLLGVWSMLVPVGVARATQGPVRATAKDDGRTLALQRGQELQITLESNHTTGYSWTVTRTGDPVLAQQGEPAYTRAATPAGAVGGGGMEIWRFRATRAGRETLRMEYRRAWEREVAPARAVTVTVVVK